jgi:plastocyanin
MCIRRFGECAKYLTRAMSLAALLACSGITPAQHALPPVTAQVQIDSAAEQQDQEKPGRSTADLSNVVVWLTPLDHPVNAPETAAEPTPSPQLVQHNKTFIPHVLVVQVGTVVEFPNRDPFFHNIFSLFDGKRFDLGLYESGTTRTVRFDRAGVSFLFCNIHAEMSAVVVAVETRYFGTSDRLGHLAIGRVPDGSYQMHVWYERSSPDELKGLSQRVLVSESMRSLGNIRVIENPNFTTAHKNKYGQDYVPPPRSNYVHP